MKSKVGPSLDVLYFGYVKIRTYIKIVTFMCWFVVYSLYKYVLCVYALHLLSDVNHVDFVSGKISIILHLSDVNISAVNRIQQNNSLKLMKAIQFQTNGSIKRCG